MADKKRRRPKGDGGLYQRHSEELGCPPLITKVDEDGREYQVRPKHKSCRGMWVGSLQLPPQPGKKRRRKYVYSKTKEGVRTKLAKLRDELTEHGDLPTDDMLLSTWLTYWLDEIVPGRTDPKTLGTYRTSVTQYIVPSIGTKRLDRLTPEHVRSVHKYVLGKTRTRIIDGKRVQVPLSIATAKNAHTALGVALADAVKEGRVNRNVVDRVDPPKGRPKPRGALDAGQARALLAAVADDRLGARWATALLEATRQGETLGLEWDRVDLDAGQLDVAWQLKALKWLHGCGDKPCGRARGTDCPKKHLEMPRDYDHRVIHGRLVLARPKSERSMRIMPIPDPLVAALRRRHELYLAERGEYTTDHGLVFVHRDGRPIDLRLDNKNWHALLAGLDMPNIPLHSAKHTTVTLLRSAGVPADVVRDIAGHAGLTTQETYRHEDISRQRAALAQLAESLSIEQADSSEEDPTGVEDGTGRQ